MKRIDTAALDRSYREVLGSGWSRLGSGEPPVELLDLTAKFPFIKAISGTMRASVQYSDWPPLEHVADAAAGSFMASAALAHYDEARNELGLQDIDQEKLSDATVAFTRKLRERYTYAANALCEDFPFANTLIDAAFNDAIETGLSFDRAAQYGGGALRAAGIVAVYAEF